MNNIFKHNSRTYYDAYSAFVQAYPNKPTWMFQEMAGMFDFQSELQNRIATDILYPQTRESAYAFAARCDYAPAEAAGATALVTVTLTGAMAKTLAVGYQFGAISTATGKMLIYEVTTATASGGMGTISNIPVTQKKTVENVLIGTVDTSDSFMDFPIEGYTNIISDSISLTIDSVIPNWTLVSNFDDSISTDKHFRLVYQSSGKCRVQFGDGTNGDKPDLNDVIYADFATTDGIHGALTAGDISINVGNDSDISTLTNAADCAGGSNPESIASILRNARANARLRNMVWSKEDLEIAAIASNAGIVHAYGVPGIGTATIYVVAGGAANASSLLTIVEDYVTALTQFGIMPVTVLDTPYTKPNIKATFTMRTGFTSAIVKKLVEFAMTLASCAFDIEVIEYFDDNGIVACREDVIDIRWAGEWDFSDYTGDDLIYVDNALTYIINQWKNLLGTENNRQYGMPLEIGDLWMMGNALYDYGVDVFSLTAPTANTATAYAYGIIDTGVVEITDATV